MAGQPKHCATVICLSLAALGAVIATPSTSAPSLRGHTSAQDPQAALYSARSLQEPNPPAPTEEQMNFAAQVFDLNFTANSQRMSSCTFEGGQRFYGCGFACNAAFSACCLSWKVTFPASPPVWIGLCATTCQIVKTRCLKGCARSVRQQLEKGRKIRVCNENVSKEDCEAGAYRNAVVGKVIKRWWIFGGLSTQHELVYSDDGTSERLVLRFEYTDEHGTPKVKPGRMWLC